MQLQKSKLKSCKVVTSIWDVTYKFSVAEGCWVGTPNFPKDDSRDLHEKAIKLVSQEEGKPDKALFSCN